jgi:hypothetical protein
MRKRYRKRRHLRGHLYIRQTSKRIYNSNSSKVVVVVVYRGYPPHHPRKPKGYLILKFITYLPISPQPNLSNHVVSKRHHANPPKNILQKNHPCGNASKKSISTYLIIIPESPAAQLLSFLFFILVILFTLLILAVRLALALSSPFRTLRKRKRVTEIQASSFL